MLRTAILAAVQLVSAVLYDASVPAHTRLPIYDNGYLVFTYSPGDAAFTVYGPDGTRLFDGLVKLPQPAALQLGNAAADTNGTVAITLGYLSGQEHAGAIALFDRFGRQTGFVETGGYLPTAAAFDADHMLWALGWQADSADYRLFRKFSRDGKEVGAYIERSLFPKGLEPGRVAAGQKGMYAAHGRIGALVASGMAGDLREWVELDLSGKLLGRWRMDHLYAANLGFTAGGALYGSTPYEKGRPIQLTAFDRTTDSWNQVPGDFKADWLLMGADGNNVVLWEQGTAPMLLRYVRP